MVTTANKHLGLQVERKVREKIRGYWGSGFIHEASVGVAIQNANSPLRADFLYPHRRILVEAKSNKLLKGRQEVDCYIANMFYSGRPLTGEYWGVTTNGDQWWTRQYKDGLPDSYWEHQTRRGWHRDIGRPGSHKKLSALEKSVYKNFYTDLIDGKIVYRCNKCLKWKQKRSFLNHHTRDRGVYGQCRRCQQQSNPRVVTV